jgi:hypothetical protein
MHRVEIRYETKASLGCYVSWPSAAQILAAESYNANVEYWSCGVGVARAPIGRENQVQYIEKTSW